MINWLTDNIGTGAFEKVNAAGTDAVIVDVRDLVDKAGNNETLIHKKIEQSVALLNEKKKIVICCDYGMSRSNSIAAGVISQWNNVSFEEAVNIVKRTVSESGIKLDMLASVYNALNKNNAAGRETGKRILITGGTGFVGSSLKNKLAGDCVVFTPGRKEIDLMNDIVSLDLWVKINHIDTILHLANPRIYTTNSCMGETLVMLRNVLDVCRANDVKLVYVSSWEVFSGYKANYLLADESLPLLAKGPYGETKWFCELLIDQYRKMYGLRSLTLRSGPLYGTESDKPKFIYNFIGKALRDEKIVTHKYSNGFPLLDLLSVDDFIAALIPALKSNYEGVINIGSGQARTTYEIAGMIVEIMGSKSELGYNNIDTQHPGIAMDISLAEKVLGWKPATNVRDGIKKIIDHINGK